jgi:hypothetical protein
MATLTDRRVYVRTIPVLVGAQIVRQNVPLPPAVGGRGHVYRNVVKGEWYVVRTVAQGQWLVATYQGADCPCGG